MRRKQLIVYLRRIFLGICLIFFPSAQISWAKTIHYPKQALIFGVQQGRKTEVHFPGRVAKIAKSGDPESVLIDNVNEILYITPKYTPIADISVITEDGTNYPLSFTYGKDYDGIVTVLLSQPDEEKPKRNYTIALMQDLLTGRVPAGANVYKSKKSVLLKNENLQITIDVIYELPRAKAYVMTAENLLNTPVILPVQQITFPKLLAIASEKDMLMAKGMKGSKSLVYMVIRK